MTTPAALYARISVHDVRVPKVANQLTDLRKLAADHGYEVMGEYADDGISASTGEARPDFERLVADLDAGKIGVILATEEARLARNSLEKAGLVLACTRVGATWETIRDGAVDPSTATGAFMATVRGGVDAFESARKAERQRAANLHRRDAGLHAATGPRPFGWQEDRVTVADAEARLIKEGTAAILAGRSLSSVTRDWRASGVAPARSAVWSRVSVQKTLMRWRNAAVVSHKDEPLKDGQREKDGKWEKIVDCADLKAVRAILSASRSGAKRVASRLCSGIAHCGCGEYMIASGSNGAPAYMCSARVRGVAKPGSVHSGIKAEMLESAVREAVLATYFKTPVGTGAAEAEARTLSNLYERRAKAGAAIDRLADQVDAGTFKPAEIATKAARRRKEIGALDQEIAQLASRSAHAAMLQESMAALWVSAADAMSLPAFAPNGDGTRTWRSGTALIATLEREGMTREEAINRAVVHFWEDNPDAPAVREELGRRFDALPLEQRRNLVRSLLSVVVKPGRGTGRVAIEPVT